MAKSGGKRILLAVSVLAVAGVAYLTVNRNVDPIEGAEGTIGAAGRHQMEKTQYYEEDHAGALGRIAAKFEYDPPEAEKMLKERGWSKEEFDKMIKNIRGNDELQKAFETAKKLASQR